MDFGLCEPYSPHENKVQSPKSEQSLKSTIFETKKATMEKRTFTTEQIQTAKKFPIVELLQRNGFQPVKHDNKGVWYYSPFRTERNPSFFVDNQNGFYDFGAGTGGDVIKLLCQLKNISFVEAVKILLENQDFFFVSPKTDLKEKETSSITIESVKPLQGNYFKNYIESRKISFEIAKEYLKVIYYKLNRHQKKCFFGVGMENVLKGYELKNIQQNKYYCIFSKAPTLIDKGQAKFWSIFEGMFDFLACLTYYQKPIQTNVIILHSANQARKAIELIPAEVEKIFLFLDNDTAGDQATETLTAHFIHVCNIKDYRNTYKNYKDFNEFLQKNS